MHEEALKIINLIAPKHQYKDCSDDATNRHGFHCGRNDNGTPSCQRCGLIQYVTEEWYSKDYELRISFDRILSPDEIRLRELEDEARKLRSKLGFDR